MIVHSSVGGSSNFMSQSAAGRPQHGRHINAGLLAVLDQSLAGVIQAYCRHEQGAADA
jgi:hypothetical protein